MAVDQNIQERRMSSRSKIAIKMLTGFLMYKEKMGEGRRIRKCLDTDIFLPKYSSL